MPSFTSEQIDTTQLKYQAKHLNPSYKGYSPFQCAVYDGNLTDVQCLLEVSNQTRTFLQTLSAVNNGPEETHETSLHIAIKHPAIFDFLTEILWNFYPNLLITQLKQGDCDGDRVLHQIIEFGRTPALERLKVMASMDDAIKEALIESLGLVNLKSETPQELAQHFKESLTFEKSRTMMSLEEDGVEVDWHHSKTQLDDIMALMDEIERPRPRCGMR